VSPPPKTSSSSTLPWWEVLAVVIVIVVALVTGTLVYRDRRSHGSRRSGTGYSRRVAPSEQFGGTIQPWDGAGPSSSAGIPSTVPNGAVGATSMAGAGATTAAEATPDIDELMTRLERMSIQMFNKTPKELSAEPPAGESAEESAKTK